MPYLYRIYKDREMINTRDVNLDYLIKVYGKGNDGVRVDKLVGIKGLIELVGEELAFSFIERAYLENQYKCICKLRRGLKVTFYSK